MPQDRFERSRVLLADGDELLSLLWIDRGRSDGSVYLGPFDPSTRQVEVAVIETTSDEPSMDILFPWFEEKFELYDSPKISFHPAQKGLEAQIHLRGQAATKKTAPIVLDRWDVVAEAPRRCGLIVLPELALLPKAGAFDARSDLALPLTYQRRKAYGGRFEVTPPGAPVAIREETGATALFESAYGNGAIILRYEPDAGRPGAPFLLVVLASRGPAPFRAVNIGFRQTVS